jgi:RNA ligase
MPTLADIFDPAELAHCIADRLVVARKHPTYALTILNYTERCQYERGLWNPVTLACRGLIHDADGNIIARPFRKFFNYGQSEAGALDLAARCIATDKLDGSLGILYYDGAEWSIATRGSFDSEQARHATALYRREYAPRFTPPAGWTLLFEIVYPENRIVLDYGGRDDLILLGGVDIATGRSRGTGFPALCGWPGPRAEKFGYQTVADALAAPPRPNAEGLVLHLIDSDERVKIKQEDYVALHRIVTGLNERMVWEHVAAGKPVSELLGALPDEFHSWVVEVADRLVATVERNAADVETAYSTILAALPESATRKDFALAAKAYPFAGYLFSRLDGKDYRARLWQDAYPAGRLGPRGLVPTEETA